MSIATGPADAPGDRGAGGARAALAALAPMTFPPSLDSFEARLGVPVGSLEGTDRGRATAALDDASTLVAVELPEDVDPAAWLPARVAVLALVTLKATRREYDNPRGYTYTVAGPVSASTSSTSGVYLTPGEVDTVRRAVSGTTAGFVGSVRTGSAYEG